MGGGGNSLTSNVSTPKSFNQSVTGANLSNFINLGNFAYGKDNRFSSMLSNSATSTLGTTNTNRADQTAEGGDGGGGGSFDMALSAAVGRGAKSGDVSKSGGSTFTPQEIAKKGLQKDDLMLYGGLAAGSLLLFSLINRSR